MATKISELPLTGAYRLDDYIPIVDAQGVTTRRVLFSTIATGSYGLSASFITVGTANASTEGLIRLPNNSSIYALGSDGTTNYPVVQFDTSNRAVLGNTSQFVRVGLPTNNDGSLQVGGEFIYTVGSTQRHRFYAGGTEIIRLSYNQAMFDVPIGGLSNSHITFQHSGSTIALYDTYLRAREEKATALTTSGGGSSATMLTFSNTTNGKTYAVDVIVTAQSTTTTGSLYSKYTAHYYRSSDVIGVVGSPYAILESANHAYLTASLTSSAGDILVNVNQGASAESFRWGCFLRVQEQGTS